MDKLTALEKRVEKLEKIVNSLQHPEGKSNLPQSSLDTLLIKYISKLKPQDLVILILSSSPKLTKNEIKNQFKTLGATNKMINWFNGGNFKQRLIDTGIVFEDGKKEKKLCYSLTKGKGNQTAEKIIHTLESKN